MKKLLIVLAVIVVIIVGVIAVVVMTLDPEELGQKAIAWVNESTDLELQASRFSLHPLKGLELEQAEVTGDLPSGTLSASLNRLVVAHEIWPLLRGEVVVNKIRLEEPRIEIVSSPPTGGTTGSSQPEQRTESETPTTDEAADSPPAESEESSSGPTITISEISIENGSLLARTEGDEASELEVTGFGLELRDVHFDPTASSTVAGLAARGEIQAEQIRMDDLVFQGTRGKISFAQGKTSITEFGLKTDNAALEVAELSVDLSQDPPPYHLTLAGGLDFNSLLAATGDGFGPVKLEMGAAGEGPESDRMTGDGVLHLAAGTIPSFPMISQIEGLLNTSIISGNAYEATDIHFEIANNRIEVKPFEIVGQQMRIAGSGTADLVGPVDMILHIRLPSEGISISGISGSVLDLAKDAEGFIMLPFAIGGTLEEPSVGLDTTTLKKNASRAAKDSLEEKAKEEGRKLLGRFGRKKDG